MTELKIWHRQQGETDPAYYAFKTWLELPPPRSLEKLYAGGFNPSSIPKWRDKYNWYARGVAYDNDMLDRSLAVQFDHVAGLQQTITAAGVDDYARLRRLWEKNLSRLENSYAKIEELLDEAIELGLAESIDKYRKMMDDIVAQISQSIGARTKLEAMGRTAAHMPEKYGVKHAPDTQEDILPDIMTLTFNGPVNNAPTET